MTKTTRRLTWQVSDNGHSTPQAESPMFRARIDGSGAFKSALLGIIIFKLLCFRASPQIEVERSRDWEGVGPRRMSLGEVLCSGLR